MILSMLGSSRLPPPSHMKYPSSTSIEQYNRHKSNGRLSDNVPLLQLQLAAYDLDARREFKQASETLVARVPLQCRDSFGFCSRDRTWPELNISAFLQEELAAVLDIFSEHSLRCLHQVKPADASTMDIFVGENLKIDLKFGLLPRLVIEVSTNAMLNKDVQTLAYINNLVEMFPTDKEFFMLGVTTLITSSATSFRLSAYYLSYHVSEENLRISETLMWEGSWCGESVAVMLAVLRCFIRLPLRERSVSVVRAESSRNHSIDETNNSVWKVVDYRRPNCLLEQKRQFDFSLKYLNATVMLDEGRLAIFRYPYIHGNNTPSTTDYFLNMIRSSWLYTKTALCSVTCD